MATAAAIKELSMTSSTPSAARARDSYIFTSESVSEGHPDKICDQISDAIVDAFLRENPEARTAVECFATTNHLVIGGETRGVESITPKRVEDIAREKIHEIGYEQEGFHWKNAKVEVLLHQQSADIAMGVDAKDSKDEGAGDQGIMFGYACDETPELMPAPLHYAHSILRLLSEARRSGAAPQLRPDAKSQVSLVYERGRPIRASSIVVSTQHTPEISQRDIRELVRGYVAQVLPEGWLPPEQEFYVNPTGQFIIGGPDGDAGLTGRKIIVDTYGGAAPHGGGAFSGKDPTKVDRSAAYIARYLAKNVVAAELATRCTIQLSYAIGVSKPISVYVKTVNGQVDEAKLERVLQELVDLSPRGIRKHLRLNRPIYAKTAAYGHFGRAPEADGSFSWERTDLVEQLKGAF
jgi:S-adenosylmethionine synthetase